MIIDIYENEAIILHVKIKWICKAQVTKLVSISALGRQEVFFLLNLYNHFLHLKLIDVIRVVFGIWKQLTDLFSFKMQVLAQYQILIGRQIDPGELIWGLVTPDVGALPLTILNLVVRHFDIIVLPQLSPLIVKYRLLLLLKVVVLEIGNWYRIFWAALVQE